MRITKRQLIRIIREAYTGTPEFTDPSGRPGDFQGDPYLKGSYDGNGMTPTGAWRALLPAMELIGKPLYMPAITVVKTGKYSPQGGKGVIYYVPFLYGDKVLADLQAELDSGQITQDVLTQELIDEAGYALQDRDNEYMEPYTDW